MKFGHASLITHGDTLTGSLEYASQITAQGTMTYKHQVHPEIAHRENLLLARKQVTLKIIPGIDGTPEIAQLIGITFENVTVEGAWIGNARLDLTPSVNCTLADLPVHQVTGGVHLVTSMTLPYGHLLHDYLA
jgi:acetoacetate decarboxylase